MNRLYAAFVAVVALAGPASAVGPEGVETIEIKARPITQFHIGRDETRFGPLEFIGGLELTSSSRDLGALSAFRFLEPGSDLIGVADTGFWFFGRLERDGEGRPAGIANFRMQQMVDKTGKPIDRKWEVDAEGLAVKDGIATVGFERNHRIAQFRIDPAGMKPPFRQIDFLIPPNELRQNRGFETVAHAHPYGQHEGGL